jgi:hypothetical protein
MCYVCFFATVVPSRSLSFFSVISAPSCLSSHIMLTLRESFQSILVLVLEFI